MKPAPAPDDEATGLPGLRRWSSVYAVVLGVFIVWIGLLAWLSASFP